MRKRVKPVIHTTGLIQLLRCEWDKHGGTAGRKGALHINMIFSKRQGAVKALTLPEVKRCSGAGLLSANATNLNDVIIQLFHCVGVGVDKDSTLKHTLIFVFQIIKEIFSSGVLTPDFLRRRKVSTSPLFGGFFLLSRLFHFHKRKLPSYSFKSLSLFHLIKMQRYTKVNRQIRN